MNKVLDILLSSYWGACLFIILGVLVLLYTKKNPQKNPFSVIQTDFRGSVAGFGFIAVGILIIVLKMLGKW